MFNLISADMFDFSDVGIRWYTALLVTIGYIAFLAVTALIVSLIKKRRGQNAVLAFETRDLTYGGVCLAITVALSIFPIYRMPYGGSVTIISIAPIFIYCYYFGFHKGLLVSTIYTVINLMWGPYIVNPFSMILDYLLPFSALSIVGIASYSAKRYNKNLEQKKHPLKAHWPIFVTSAVYIAVRYASHVLAGVLWYYDIDLATQWGITGKLAYSMAYNHFAIVDYLIAMIAVVSLLSSKAFNTFMASHRNTLQKADGGAKDD